MELNFDNGYNLVVIKFKINYFMPKLNYLYESYFIIKIIDFKIEVLIHFNQNNFQLYDF